MNGSLWPERVIRWAFYLLFIFVPLILTPWNYELFEYNKMMLVYALTVIVAAAWAVQMIQNRHIRIAKTPLDIPIALFVASQLVSTLFSIDPHVSWNGYYSRFNGGMWSIISYVILYYALVSHATANGSRMPKEEKKPSLSPLSSIIPFLNVAVATAAVVSLYGVAERLGVDKHLWVQDVQNRVFSSLGQPNWLAAYLAALVPIAMAMGIAKSGDGRWRIHTTFLSSTLCLLSSVLFFLVLLFTRSRSGLAGIFVADIIFWALFFITTGVKNRRFLYTAGILHLVFAAIVCINGTSVSQIDRYATLSGLQSLITNRAKHAPPAQTKPVGPLLEVGGTESGTIRKYVWQAAVTAWRSTTKTFLIGTGTETFAFAFYRFRPVGHNLTSEWDFLYNKAHNEYLNYLATTGAVGLGSYAIFILAFILWFIRKVLVSGHPMPNQAQNAPSQRGPLDQLQSRVIVLALFAGWLSILVTNFFGFSVVIIQLFFFLFPAMAFVLRQKTSETAPCITRSIRLRHPAVLIGATAASAFVLLTVVTLRWRADTLFASSYRLARSDLFARALPLIEQAIRFNPGEPLYHDEAAGTLAALAASLANEKNATTAGELATRSLQESDRALTISPKNVNFWKTRTKIYYTLASVDPSFNSAAIGALEKAKELSPNDPKIYYNLAILYGRENKADKAIEFLTRAKELKPNYRDPYYALYVFYMEAGQKDRARLVIKEYVDTVDPTDVQFTELLGSTP